MSRVLFLLAAIALNGHFSAAQTFTAKSKWGTFDLTPAISFFAPTVQTMSTPVYMWNWFHSKPDHPEFSGPLEPEDPNRLLYLHQMASGYWQDLCSHNPAYDPADCEPTHVIDSWDSYGSGLYLARDPVVTSSEGHGPDWVLLQIQLPSGLRYIDLRATMTLKPVPESVVTLFRNLECPVIWTEGNVLWLSEILSAASPHADISEVSGACKIAIRTIFKEALKIDGFFFPHLGVQFEGCSPGTEDSIPGDGFVLVDDAKIRQVAIFNSQTKGRFADRLRIQSLFYKASHDDPRWGTTSCIEKHGFPDYPGLMRMGGDLPYSCNFWGCNWETYTLCGLHGECKTDVPAPRIPPLYYPIIMRAGHLPLSMPISFGSSLLWPDLEGYASDVDLDPWIRSNIYKCN